MEYIIKRKNPLFLILILCLFSQDLWAQRRNSKIVNDSTKIIYGLETTKYRLESDILDDIDTLRSLDSTMDGFHQYNMVNSNQNLYVDLASYGSAMRPLFYQTPSQIGTTLGLSPYQPYLRTPDKVRYYDTKSPYTKASFALGLRGDQMINFLYTRNIGRKWNFGFEYRRLNSDRQFGRGAAATQRLSADHHDFVAHVSYLSKNGRYKLLYHFSHLNQMTVETGGIYMKPGDTKDSIYGFQLETVNLQGTDGWQTQNNHHLYQEFKFGNGFQMYHIFERIRQRDVYVDDSIGRAGNNNYNYFYKSLYPGLSKDSTIYSFNKYRTEDGQVFQQFENTVGIKGKFGGFYYQAYAKNRIFDYQNTYQGATGVDFAYDSTSKKYKLKDTFQVNTNRKSIQNFIGGKLFYQFSPGNRFSVDLEYLIGKLDYKLNALFEFKTFQLRFKSVSVSPTLMQNQYVSNFFRWDNKFQNIFTQEISGGLVLAGKKILFNPYFSYQLISNYIYNDTLARPEQSAKSVQIARAGLNLNYQLGKWHTVNQFAYTLSLGEDLIRMPTLFLNARIYCEDCIFSKFLNSQIGVEMSYKSDYYADGYLPVTKQFHLQNSFLVSAYPILDVFVNMKFGRNARFFMKYYHINSRKNFGYTTTPVYAGMPGTFAFGLTWMFFN